MGRVDPRKPLGLTGDLAEQFRAMGATVSNSAIRREHEEMIEVWAVSADSLDAWLACATQWRVMALAMGALVWLGLDYPGVDVVLRRQAPADPDRVFADLQAMEIEALAAFGEVQA